MTIRKRLALSFFLILALFALDLVVFSWGNRRRAEAFDLRTRAMIRRLNLAEIRQQVRELKQQIGLLSSGVATTPAPDEIAGFGRRINEISQQINELQRLSPPNDRALVGRLGADFQKVGLAWLNFYRTQGRSDTASLQELALVADPLSEDILRNQLPPLQQQEILRAREAGQSALRITRLTDRTTAVLFGLSVLLAGVVGYILSRYLTNGLGELTRGAALIGAERLDHRIQLAQRGGDDEMGRLAASFNDMASSLQTTQSRLHQAHAELERRYEELERRDAAIREANARLVESEKTALAATQAKSDFLAKMSHELRTPLNAIIGYSEILQDDAEDAGQNDFVPDLEKIRAAGKHLLALINDILDLSKIEAGKMELYLEDIAVAAMVREIASTVQPLVEKKRNELVIDCPDDPGVLHADLTKLRQILFNLLSNAAKFTENGTVTLSVRPKVVNGAEWITFRVADTGIGMTPTQMQKLFQEFSQVDASTTRKYGGTGLGLVITQHFCRMMGGDVTVTSAASEGSAFTIFLPRRVTDPKTARPVEAAPPDETATKATEHPVLVIDDDPAVHDLMRRVLAREGCRVVGATTGEDGLRLARELRPAVITLDVVMPQQDGWAVLLALKADPETADMPVVMLTMVDDKNLGLVLGASDYLTKPIDRDRLLSVLSRYRRDQQVCRILVVEDDESTRALMRRLLEKEGWDVIEAHNGCVGLERLQQETERPPALILLDIMMPEMNGFQFVAELRKRADWRAIPIVVVTAKDVTEDDRVRLNGHVAKVLQKGSYSGEELLSEIHELIRGCVAAAAPRPTKKEIALAQDTAR